MTKQSFLTQLVVFSSGMAIALYLLSTIPKVSMYDGFGWVCLIVFILLSLGLFFLGKKSAASENKYAFTQLVIMTMIVKLFLSFFISVLYYQLMDPPTKFFVIPLCIVYLGYTIFETYFMMKIGNPQSAK